MITFKDFLTELSKIVRSFKKILTSIKFGGIERIVFPVSLGEKVDTGIGSQGKVGMYSEYVTAQYLIKFINDDGLNVLFNKHKGDRAVAAIDNITIDFKKVLLDVDNPPKAYLDSIVRQEDSGRKLATAIYQDSIEVAPDLAFVTFEIILSGVLLSGIQKADIIVEIRKDDTDEVVDTIMASLKAYKGYNVGIVDSTVASFFSKLGITLDDISDEKMITNGKIRQNISAAVKKNDYRSVVKMYGKEVASVVKPMFDGDPKRKPTEQDMVLLLSAYKKNSDVFLGQFIKTWERAYKKNKKEVNHKILSMLGFDDAEDFYLAVQQKGDIRVVSSRTSTEYKRLIKVLNGQYELKINHPKGNTSSMQVKFIDPRGNIILSGSLSFGASSRVGNTKIGFFINFKNLKKDAR